MDAAPCAAHIMSDMALLLPTQLLEGNNCDHQSANAAYRDGLDVRAQQSPAGNVT